MLFDRTASNCTVVPQRGVNNSGNGEAHEPGGIVDVQDATSDTKDVKPVVHEITKTTKPEVRSCKRVREKEELTSQMLKILDQEQNEKVEGDGIELVFGATAKRIKCTLNAEQTDDLMDEINLVVARFIHSVRPGTCTPPSTQNTQPAQNLAPAPAMVKTPLVEQLPPMPPMVQMPRMLDSQNNIAYDPITDQTFHQF